MLLIYISLLACNLQMVRGFVIKSNPHYLKLPRIYLAGSAAVEFVTGTEPFALKDGMVDVNRRMLFAGQRLSIHDANLNNYLSRVMRLQEGSRFRAFNGESGEFICSIVDMSMRKRSASAISIEILEQVRAPTDDMPHSASLLFAPIKKPRMKVLVEKATELGVSSLVPVVTQNTDVVCDVDGLAATAVEAAEQCERLSVPPILAVRSIKELQSNMPAGVTLVCAERSLGTSTRPLLSVLDELILDSDSANEVQLNVFVGPEGGFADAEAAALETLPGVRLVSLGPSVLRAETAVLSALGTIVHQRAKFLA